MMEPDARELQVKEKKEVTASSEQTQTGLVYTPEVDIFETEQALTLLADMPGVTPENLSIDLREDVLTLSGNTVPAQSPSEEPLVIEYGVGKYYRQFTLSEMIDQTKITAVIKDGVLRLTLPKIEKASPRKITVSAG